MNFADINPKLSYNKGTSKNSYEDRPEFSTYQDNLSNNNYYCGGSSSLALRGMQMDNSELSEMYFSDENMERLQRQIRREVYRESNGKFKLEVDQDKSDLLIIMRAVFLENARHLPTKIISQVKELNKLTLEYLIPDLMSNIRQDIGYLRDITTPLKPLDRPLNVNRGGRKTLPSFTTTWGV